MTSISRSDFIDIIARASQRDRLALFVGAGLSKGSGLPLWSELLEEPAKRVLGTDTLPAGVNWAEIADAYANRGHGAEGDLRAMVVESIRKANPKPNAAHAQLAALRPRAVFTTNYDDLLMEALKPLDPRRITDEDEAVAWNTTTTGLPVFHLHGHVDTRKSLVLTRTDYLRYALSHPNFVEALDHHLAHFTVLFIGYGGGDMHFEVLSDLVAQRGRTLASGNAAILVSELKPLEAARWNRFDANTYSLGVPYDQATSALATFLAEIGQAINAGAATTVLRFGNPLADIIRRLAPPAFPADWQPSRLTQDIPAAPDDNIWVGRETELADLRSSLAAALAPTAEGSARTVAIASVHGRGGIGKSALAAKFVEQCLADTRTFPHGVLWYRVGTHELAHSVEQISRQIGLTANAQLSDEIRQRHLIHALAQLDCLVVLDNLDLPDRWPPLQRLLKGLPILITTRVTLGVFTVSLKELPDDEALDLFKRHAGITDTRHDNELHPIIKDQLECAPLAIELAAIAYHENHWSPARLRIYLREKLDFIDQEPLPPNPTPAQIDSLRHKNVRASFLISWDTVSSQHARQLFALASLFQGTDFLVSQLQSLANGVTEVSEGDLEFDAALNRLISRHLVDRVGEDRLLLFPLMRGFANEQLVLLKERMPSEKVHQVLARQFAAELKGNVEFGRTDLKNIEGILRALLASEDFVTLDPLLHVAFDNWFRQGEWSTALEWLAEVGRLVVRVLPRQEGDALTQVRSLAAWCVMQHGDLLMRRGRHAAAIEAYEQATDLWSRLADGERNKGWIACWSGCSAQSRGADADMDLKAVLSGLRLWGTHRDVASAFLLVVSDRALTWEWHQPAGILEAGVGFCELSKNNTDHARGLGVLAKLALDTGEITTAQQHLLNGLKTLESKPDQEVLSNLCLTDAMLQSHSGDKAGADAAFDEAQRISTHLGATEDLHWTLLGRADAAIQAQAAAVEVLPLLQQASEGFDALGIPAGQVECRVLRAEVTGSAEMKTSELRDLRATLDEAGRSCHRLGLPMLNLRVELLKGLCLAESGLGEAARERLVQCRITRESLGLKPRALLRLEHLLESHTRSFAAPPHLPQLIRIAPDWIFQWDQLPARVASDDGTPMILIPAGWTVTKGEKGDWKLWLPPFYIDEQPVTNGQYAAFCEARNHPTPPYWSGGSYPAGYEHRPVTGVSQTDAEAYATNFGKALPNRWEWHTAMQGRDGWDFPWGMSWQDGQVPEADAEDFGDCSFHPLTTFDDVEFCTLLRGSLSLSPAEKRRVVDAIPTLSQYQVDELIKVFTEENEEFRKLMPQEGETIEALKLDKQAELVFASGYAPRDVGDSSCASPFGLLDSIGLVRERLLDGHTVGYEAGVTHRMKSGLWASYREEEVFSESLPLELRRNLLAGFRCVRPMIGATAVKWALSQRA